MKHAVKNLLYNNLVVSATDISQKISGVQKKKPVTETALDIRFSNSRSV